MQDKVVLITGSSSGIGAGIAVHFASQGCRLSLTGRDHGSLQETLRKCLEVGAKKENLITTLGDLEKEEDIKMVLDETIKTFGKLDVLINNAGLIFEGSVQNTRLEEYDKIMNVNLRAVFILTQLCIPHLIQTKGNIVNVSSYFSTTPANEYMAYCLSKAALDHFTRMAAKELGRQQVRVNSVNPGYVRTNLEPRAGIDITDESIEKWHVLGRAGTVEEIAKAVSFLADNDCSSFVTGELLYIDGGASLLGI